MDEKPNPTQKEEENGQELSLDGVKEDLEKQKELIHESDPQEGSTFKEIQEPDGTAKGSNIDFILDIPLHVSVELGRVRMTIHDLLQLGQGSVVELNKLAGEPVEVMVNEKLIARGEVVRVNEKLGVRLTDVLSPMERVEQLR